MCIWSNVRIHQLTSKLRPCFLPKTCAAVSLSLGFVAGQQGPAVPLLTVHPISRLQAQHPSEISWPDADHIQRHKGPCYSGVPLPNLQTSIQTLTYRPGRSQILRPPPPAAAAGGGSLPLPPSRCEAPPSLRLTARGPPAPPSPPASRRRRPTSTTTPTSTPTPPPTPPPRRPRPRSRRRGRDRRHAGPH